MKSAYDSCIQDCLTCHQSCFQHAMTHCLESGGPHVAPTHFRTMMNCADLCQTAARFMMSASPHATSLCQVCADLCSECAECCEAIGDMSACVEACRRCAESCRQMAA